MNVYIGIIIFCAIGWCVQQLWRNRPKYRPYYEADTKPLKRMAIWDSPDNAARRRVHEQWAQRDE